MHLNLKYILLVICTLHFFDDVEGSFPQLAGFDLFFVLFFGLPCFLEHTFKKTVIAVLFEKVCEDDVVGYFYDSS